MVIREYLGNCLDIPVLKREYAISSKNTINFWSFSMKTVDFLKK